MSVEPGGRTKPYECAHEECSLRFRRLSNGGIQYVQQCHACGRAIGSAIKHSEVLVLPPEFDYALNDRWLAQEREASVAALGGRLAARKAEYQQYLQTWEWKERRRKVLERARWVCEGCRAERATEVHHLTYSHIFHELLYQLVALCDGCHAAVHGVEHQERALDDA